ncbi:MAG TPA: alpha/beta hydrolase-fold protein [Acidimicrobiia bacterium]|nr:alpha/beta hydrolase-fold protein [Acidimicrobiia bacterium]
MKATERWQSERVGTEFNLVRWGTLGTPVLIFPTAGGDCEEIERFHLIDALGPLLGAGRIKVYSVDSLNGRAFLTGADSRHASWLMTAFDDAIYHEVVPAIRQDCRSDSIEVITAGASIGAFNALEVLCRHPDVFRAALCVSGTFDLTRWMRGPITNDFYFSSPLHYLPTLADGPQLDWLRRRLVLLTHGQGRAEEPGESWRVAEVLGRRLIPNRVEEWGPEWPHDWITWREMFPIYLDQLTS